MKFSVALFIRVTSEQPCPYIRVYRHVPMLEKPGIFPIYLEPSVEEDLDLHPLIPVEPRRTN
jgi:hypothetical protein